MKSILTAIVFMTRLPLPLQVSGDDVGRAARWFPLAGALIGGLTALVAAGLSALPHLPSWMGAVTVVTVWVLATGAIHLDGLADFADGFGGRNRQDVLRIMRDPRLGSFGVLALVLTLGMKVGAVATLWARGTLAPALIAAPTMARWTCVALGVWLPYGRPDGGIGRAASRRHDLVGLAVATATAVAVAAWMFGSASLPLWAVVLMVTVGVGRTAHRRIGGVTGDVFGASVELTEVAILTGAVLMPGRA